MFPLSSSRYLHPKAGLLLFLFLTVLLGPIKDVLPLPRSLALFLLTTIAATKLHQVFCWWCFSVFILCSKLHLSAASHFFLLFFFSKYTGSCLLTATMCLRKAQAVCNTQSSCFAFLIGHLIALQSVHLNALYEGNQSRSFTLDMHRKP